MPASCTNRFSKPNELHFYTSASDSYIYCANDNYTAAWTSTWGTAVYWDPVLGVGQSSPSTGIGPATKYEIWRAYLYFNMTALPTSLSIQKAVLTLYTTDIEWINTNFNITIQNGQPTYPHDANQATDFDKTKYSGIGGQLSTVGLTEGFHDLILNPTGISWINAGGWTKLCLRSDRDIDGIPPTNGEKITILASEYDNGSYRARLSIYPKSTIAPPSVGGESFPITLQTPSPTNALQRIVPWIYGILALAIATSFVAIRRTKKRED